MSFYTYKDGYNQKARKFQLLLKEAKKLAFYTQLEGMQNGAAAAGNTLGLPQQLNPTTNVFLLTMGMP